MSRGVTGFDYRAGVEVKRTRSEWSGELRQVVAAGGRRRVEDEETFAHGPDGKLVFEVYGNVPTGGKRS